jgi:hypothetical protein
MAGDSRVRSGGRLFLPIVVVVLLYVATAAAAAAAVESAWEEEYGTSVLLRKRHEVSPLRSRGSGSSGGSGGGGGLAQARDDDADDLRVVRAMQWAAESADETQRRGLAEIAGACAAAPQARARFSTHTIWQEQSWTNEKIISSELV